MPIGPGSKVGEAFVEIGAKLKSLEDGLDQAQTMTEGTARKMRASMELMAARVEIAMEHMTKAIQKPSGQIAKNVSESTSAVGKSTSTFNSLFTSVKNGATSAASSIVTLTSKIGSMVSALTSKSINIAQSFGLAGLAAGAGGLAGLGAAVKSADDLAKSYNYAGLVFGNFSRIVVEESNRISSKFGASRRELVQGASEIGEVFRRAGASAPLAARLTSEMLPMVSAIARVRDINLPEALKAIEYGLEGSTRGLRRLGITVRDEQVEMEAFRLGLVKLGGSFSESDLTIARASLMMRMMGETTKVLEGSNLSLSAKVSAAWAKIQHAFEDVGIAFLPIAHRLIDNVNSLSDRISAWVSNHKADMDYFVSSTQWAIDQVRDGLIVLYNTLSESLGGKGIDFSSFQSALVSISVTVRGFFEDFGIYARIAGLKFVELGMNIKDVFDWLKTIVKDYTDTFNSYWEVGVTGAITKSIGFLHQWYKDAQKGAAALGDIVGSALTGGKAAPGLAGAAGAGGAAATAANTPLELSLRGLGKEIDELYKRIVDNNRIREDEIAERKKPFVGPPAPEEKAAAPEKERKALKYPPQFRAPVQAEFVGIADFWKKVQIGALSGQPNYQQKIEQWTQRTAIAAEKLAAQGDKGNVAVAAGPE